MFLSGSNPHRERALPCYLLHGIAQRQRMRETGRLKHAAESQTSLANVTRVGREQVRRALDINFVLFFFPPVLLKLCAQLFPNQQHRSAHISRHGTPHKLWHLCSSLQIYFVLLLFSYRRLFNTLTLIWQTLKQRWLDESDFLSTSRQSFSINIPKYMNADSVHAGGRLYCFVWYFFGKRMNLCYWRIDFRHCQQNVGRTRISTGERRN